MAYLGFNTLKNALCSLNVVYMMVGLLLIVVAAWGKGYGNVNSISIIGGVIAVGIFLLLISFIGLYGALKNHQVMLFFYMIILLLLFLIQFGVSCSCLALNRGQQEKLLATSWALMSSETRENLELHLNCCGFVNSTATSTEFNMDLNRCQAPCKIARNCFTCGDLILQHSSDVLKILGGLGLFFSFTDVSVPLGFSSSLHTHTMLSFYRTLCHSVVR